MSQQAQDNRDRSIRGGLESARSLFFSAFDNNAYIATDAVIAALEMAYPNRDETIDQLREIVDRHIADYRARIKYLNNPPPDAVSFTDIQNFRMRIATIERLYKDASKDAKFAAQTNEYVYSS